MENKRKKMKKGFRIKFQMQKKKIKVEILIDYFYYILNNKILNKLILLNEVWRKLI